MDVTTVSPKFQVVIPRGVREQMGLKAGQKLQVVPATAFAHQATLLTQDADFEGIPEVEFIPKKADQKS